MSETTLVTSHTANAVAPVITVKPDTTDPSGMSVIVTVDNHGNGMVILAWGQTPTLPTNTNPGDGATPTNKKYTAAGDWTITATPIAPNVPPGTQPVTIPWPAPKPAPVVTAKPDADDPTGMTVTVTVDNHGNGPVQVDWGQTPALPTDTNPGDGTTPTSRQYAVDGTWTITATDLAHPLTPPGTTQVTVPEQLAPALSVTADPEDPSGMTVLLLVDNHSHGPCTVDWGQTPELPPDVNIGDGVNPSQGVYTTAGTWTITATDYTNASATPGTVEVVVPMVMPPALTVGAGPDDDTRLTVEVLVDSHGLGVAQLDYGDGSGLDYNVGDNVNPSEHQYATAATYTITATLVDHPDVDPVTAAVTVPWKSSAPAGLTIMPDPDNDMAVLVTTSSYGNGDVVIDWGQTPTLAPTVNPGDGVTVSRQVYTQQGLWKVSTKPAFGGAGSTKSVYVPTPPAPDITVAPDPYEPSGMFVLITVDSHGHGPVRLDPGGDGQTVRGGRAAMGDGVTPTLAEYRKTGIYTVAAWGFVTANMPRATTTVEVPFPTAPVLHVAKDTTVESGLGVIVVTDSRRMGDVGIDWGQNPALPAGTNPGDGDTETSQVYTTPGTWTITARKLGDENAPVATRTITVPFPDAPTVAVERDATDPSGMSVLVTVDHYGLDAVQIDWGQTPTLTPTANPGDAATISKQPYTEPGVWTITATVPDHPEIPAGTATVYLPQPPAPAVTVAYDPVDDTGRTVIVTVDNHGNGPVDLDWGGPNLAVTKVSPYPPAPHTNPGDGSTPAIASFLWDSAKTLTATSKADPSSSTAVVFPIPSVDKMVPPVPRLVCAYVNGNPTMKVSASVFGHSYGLFTVDWGQNPPLPPATMPGDGNAHSRWATYTAPGTWPITAASDQFPDAPTGTVDFVVPHSGVAQRYPDLVSSKVDPDDPTGQTYLLEFDSYGYGDIGVDWGVYDFPVPTTVVPGDRTPVKFRPVTRQNLLVVLLWLVADPCNTMQVPLNATPDGSTRPPYPDITVDPDDQTGMTVDVKAYQPGGVTIDWGQTPALPTTDYPGDGSVVSQTYTTPGRWTVTVTAKKIPGLKTTTPITLPAPSTQPAPWLKVQADPNDDSGMSVAVLVDNGDCGPVSVDWGQTPALATSTNPGDGTTQSVQAYTTAGTWTITATDQGNPHAPTDAVAVTVPISPAPSVLIGEDGSGDTDRNRLRATVSKPKPDRTYEINWALGSKSRQNAWIPLGDDPSIVAPLGAGVWAVAVRERSVPALASRATVTVPQSGPLVSLAAGAPSDGNASVTATVTNADSGRTYEIEWGTGTGFSDLTGTPPSGSKQLASPGTYQVTVRDKAQPTDRSVSQVHLT